MPAPQIGDWVTYIFATFLLAFALTAELEQIVLAHLLMAQRAITCRSTSSILARVGRTTDRLELSTRCVATAWPLPLLRCRLLEPVTGSSAPSHRPRVRPSPSPHGVAAGSQRVPAAR